MSIPHLTFKDSRKKWEGGGWDGSVCEGMEKALKKDFVTKPRNNNWTSTITPQSNILEDLLCNSVEVMALVQKKKNSGLLLHYKS